MTSKRSQENILSVKGIDRELWKWLKARAALEDKTAAEVINGLIERYRREGGWSGTTLQESARERNPHTKLTVRGIDRELWEWLKKRAQLEDTIAGELINRLVEQYKAEAGSDVKLRMSTYAHDPHHITTIRGIDREVWQHLKDGAELEDKTVGEVLNELIEWYRREVVWP